MSDKKKTVFLTGGTGLIGSYLITELLDSGHIVYALSRSSREKDARCRLFSHLAFWDEKYARGAGSFPALNVVSGDIAGKELDMEKDAADAIRNNVGQIIHSAAITDVHLPLEEIRKVNVNGTKNLLEFAKTCPHLEKVNHLSTAYVCGDHRGDFRETDLDLNQKFNTTYEQSKFEAEKLVQEYRQKGLWIDIFRPSLVVGESKNGRINSFRNIYSFFRLCQAEIFNSMPLAGCRLSIVPVDDVSHSILTLAFNSPANNSTFHIFSDSSLSLEKVLSLAGLLMKFVPPQLVDDRDFLLEAHSPVQQQLFKKAVKVINLKVKLISEWTVARLDENGCSNTTIDDAFVKKILGFMLSKMKKGGIDAQANQ